MGIWIAVAVILFALGSIMALKPSGVEQRLDNVRMTARRLGLNPKLIATPDWLKPANEFQATNAPSMLARYSFIDDSYALPDCQFKVIDGRLRPVQNVPNSELPLVQNASQNASQTVPKSMFALDNLPIDLPDAIASQTLGISTQANSISVYWLDNNYVKPAHNTSYTPSHIEPDLLRLKNTLQMWAERINR